MVALTDAILVLVPAATFGPGGTAQVVDRGDGNGPQITSWNTAALGAQPTAAQLAAVTQAQVDAYYTSLKRQVADGLLSAPDAPYKVDRAVLLGVLDQLNVLREWLMTFQSQTALATSLADFKTRVAGLSSLPDLTAAQARAFVQNKIDGGQAD